MMLLRIETGNAGFAQDFTQWVFQETGVVKVISTHHHRKGESQPRELYTKKDDIVSTPFRSSQRKMSCLSPRPPT